MLRLLVKWHGKCFAIQTRDSTILKLNIAAEAAEHLPNMHAIVDGRCLSEQCADAKRKYLISVNEYYLKVREHDDLELDYSDYPVEELLKLWTLLSDAPWQIERSSKIMQDKYNEMERICSE